MAKILLIANIVYIPIDKELDDTTSQKYLKGSISGFVFMSGIYTEDEIREKHKTSGIKLQEVDDFLKIHEAWNKPNTPISPFETMLNAKKEAAEELLLLDSVSKGVYQIYHAYGDAQFTEELNQPRKWAGSVSAESLSDAFEKSQNLEENTHWLSLQRRSTSVGDIIVCSDGYYLVLSIGFQQLSDAEVRNLPTELLVP